jgi:periplasmic divalent cation tolerance protein
MPPKQRKRNRRDFFLLSMKPLFVYITVKDKKQARRIGRALVSEKIVACVNILDGVNSLYFWEGKLCDDTEAVLVAKTTDINLERLVDRVKKLHTYLVPCIVALPIVGGNEDFLKWVKKETAIKTSRSRN